MDDDSFNSGSSSCAESVSEACSPYGGVPQTKGAESKVELSVTQRDT